MDTETPRGTPLFRAWVVLGVVCLVLMLFGAGEETIPYHIGWAGFALAFGLEWWSRAQTVGGLVGFAVGTGCILVIRAASGVIEWQEIAEIPLMTLLILLMIWHVRRRQASLATLRLLSRRERERARAREHLTRLTSHEMRSPLTIARGHVELLLARESDPGRARDLQVVDEELDRLTRVCERLVRVIRLEGGSPSESVHVEAILRQTAARWSAVAERYWVVDASPAFYDGSAERLRACLDTLVENAVRYTLDGDTIRLFCVRAGDHVEVGVADSGVGMSREQVALINTPDDAGAGATPRDDLSQTGLGLGLVQGVVSARGGRLEAGRSPEGGALVTMHLPVQSAPVDGSLAVLEPPGIVVTPDVVPST